MSNGKPITNANLYDSLNTMRLELKGDIRDLRNQFDTLEAGRLTRAEGNISDLRLELQKAVNLINTTSLKDKEATSSLNAKFVILGVIGTAILYGLAQAIFERLIK